MALARQHGLLSYSMLRKAGLIALLRENEPTPTPSINPGLRSVAQPPRPMRPPPQPLPLRKDSFVPYELEQPGQSD